MCPKPHLSWVMKLTLAHTTALMASYTRLSHSHTPPARTPTSHMSSTAPSKHSPAQNRQGAPLGDPGSLWLATALGSSQCVSGTPHDSTPTASFDVCLLDLLWPQPPLTSSLHQGSTLGPLISVVAAFVKDARPSRWLAPLERPRWPQHRPRVAPPAKPSRLAVESVELVGPAKRFGSCMARAEAWALQRGAECSARGWNAGSTLKTPKPEPTHISDCEAKKTRGPCAARL